MCGGVAQCSCGPVRDVEDVQERSRVRAGELVAVGAWRHERCSSSWTDARGAATRWARTTEVAWCPVVAGTRWDGMRRGGMRRAGCGVRHGARAPSAVERFVESIAAHRGPSVGAGHPFAVGWAVVQRYAGM